MAILFWAVALFIPWTASASQPADANQTGQGPRIKIDWATGCNAAATVILPSADKDWKAEIQVKGRAPNATKWSIGDADDRGQVIAKLIGQPLRSGETVELSYTNAKEGLRQAASLEVKTDSRYGCRPDPDPVFSDDDRDILSTPFFVGAALEQFAPGFNDPTQSSQALRAISGVVGEYRLVRRNQPGKWVPQVWLHGGFLAGIRSYCASDNPQPNEPETPNVGSSVACSPFNPDGVGQVNKILRNATSFEVGIGARFEFLAINRGSRFPGNVYVSIRDNRFALDRVTADKFLDPVVAVGFLITGGAMRGTSFQGGFGASEFYSNDGKWNRLKTEFTLVVGAEKSTKDVLTGTDKAKDAFKFYFAVRTDFDMGSGADSVRVGMGLAFLPSAYFGAK